MFSTTFCRVGLHSSTNFLPRFVHRSSQCHSDEANVGEWCSCFKCICPANLQPHWSAISFNAYRYTAYSWTLHLSLGRVTDITVRALSLLWQIYHRHSAIEGCSHFSVACLLVRLWIIDSHDSARIQGPLNELNTPAICNRAFISSGISLRQASMILARML